MPKTYTRLTEDERYQIYEGIVHGVSHRAIAKQLGRSHSTISREAIRNKGLRGYRPRQAQSLASQRQACKPKHIKLIPEMQSVISKHIQKDWSPEQVQGRLISEGMPIVCTTTIYGFIKRDKASGGDLYQHLRHRKPYKKRTGKAEARGQIIGRISIDERPVIVDEKTRIGDWEADTVIGKGHQGVLVTLAERCSKRTLIAPVPNKRADVVRDAIITLLKSETVHTITFDNGKEFAYHAEIKEALSSDNYFAHPYHSWERGLNENHNGLIRQYLPKGMKLNRVSHEQVAAIQEKLNNRPRKTLGYKTPNEVYNAMKLAA
ncbi:MAG TPA: IS30 family transposase [Arenicellales bacterium]|jgi:IS30 family transposase|nr:IS30 family transposase [Arenicellales bacterium]